MDVKLRKNPRLLRFLSFRRKSFYFLSKVATYATIGAIAFLLILQYPIIQTRLAHLASSYLTDLAGYPIRIESVAIDWFDEIKLQGIRVKEKNSPIVIIGLEELRIDYHFKTLFRNGHIYIDDVTLKGADVNLVRTYGGTLNINDFIEALAGKSAPDTSKSDNEAASHFHIRDILVRNSHFSYYDVQEEHLDSATFDHSHFSFVNINADVSRLRIAEDTIEMQITKLSSFEEECGLAIKEITTFFRYHAKGMDYTPIYAAIGNTIITDTLIFTLKNDTAYSDFNRLVNITAKLKNSQITYSDLAYFAPSLRDFADTFHISGDFKGTVNDFRVKNLHLKFGKHTELNGSVAFDGLPDFFETFMELKFKKSTIHADDLKQYLPKYTYSVMKKFGNINFDGEFLGVINDFVSDGVFDTDIGSLDTDINLKTTDAYYKGKIITKNLDVGKIWELEKYFDRLDMTGKIEGKGLTLSTADFKLDANVSKFGINKYTYKNIVTNGRFRKELFDGTLSVNDPNLDLNITGSINFIDSSFKFNALIDTANLYEINILDIHSVLVGSINADFTGLSPEDIEGEISFRDLHLEYDTNTLNLDLVVLNTHKDEDPEGKHRDILFSSDFIDFSAEGDFVLTDLFNDSKKLLQEYILSIKNDSTINAYYADKKEKKHFFNQCRLNFDANLKDINPLLAFVTPDIKIAPRTSIIGKINIGKESNFDFTFFSDSVFLYGQNFYQDTLLLITAKNEMETGFELEMLIKSAKQSLGELLTEKLTFDFYRHENVFYFDAKIKNQQTNDDANLKGYLELFDDRYEVNLTNTTFNILDHAWANAGINKIALGKDGKITIINMVFAHEKQDINIAGIISEDSTEQLKVSLHNLDISFLSAYTDKKLVGTAYIDATLSNIYHIPTIEIEGKLDSVQLNNFYVGTIIASSKWNKANKSFALNTSIHRYQKEVLKVFGDYSPYDDAGNKLNITALLQGLSLQVAQPFVAEHIANLDGYALGYLRIKGDFTNPNIKGDILIQEGIFKVKYLGTTYTFNDKVYFKDNTISIRNLKLTDETNKLATINGIITHKNFSDISFDFKANMRNFMTLKTTRTPESLYYGTAISTGNLRVSGTPDNVEIDITATAEKGTKMYIPLDGYQGVEKQEFIEFINIKADTVVKLKAERVALNGIRLDFNLDISPDVYGEIILDQRSGDIIRAYGKGKLKMVIDTKGEFSMVGDLELLSGTYNFTLLNVINKEFDIQQGSRLSWSGDPLGATMNITAAYKQNASLAPIITNADSSILSSPEIRRKYPVSVLLNMKGAILSPEFSFGIEIQNYPSVVLAGGVPISLESYVAAFKQRIHNDEPELNRQVFSLIILKKLSPENTFSGVSETAGGSVSELLSNQLSYWVSQVDPNLEIDLDMNGTEASSLQLRMSYTLLDGRLRITRDGSFADSRNQANTSSVIGDWMVEYLITNNGELRAKMYRRQNFNAFTSVLGNNTTTTGLSLMHTKSFDGLNDLLFGDRRKKKEKKVLRANGNADEDNDEIDIPR